MVEYPVTQDVVGKYVLFRNGCFDKLRRLKIVGVNRGGTRIDFLWTDGSVFTEHIMHFDGIVDSDGNTIYGRCSEREKPKLIR